MSNAWGLKTTFGDGKYMYPFLDIIAALLEISPEAQKCLPLYNQIFAFYCTFVNTFFRQKRENVLNRRLGAVFFSSKSQCTFGANCAIERNGHFSQKGHFCDKGNCGKK